MTRTIDVIGTTGCDVITNVGSVEANGCDVTTRCCDVISSFGTVEGNGCDVTTRGCDVTGPPEFISIDYNS